MSISVNLKGEPISETLREDMNIYTEAEPNRILRDRAILKKALEILNRETGRDDSSRKHLLKTEGILIEDLRDARFLREAANVIEDRVYRRIQVEVKS